MIDNNLTHPIFVIGSGRSGTAAFYKMLAGHEEVEAHHEYLCTHVQRLGVLYYMGLKDKDYIIRELYNIYGSALLYSNSRIFIDCSNKLTWLIEPLMELFPDCKFVAISRDGRKVVTSYYYKLRCEIYDDRSTAILLNWYKNGCKDIAPPPEKRYWWNIPPIGHELHYKFSELSRFERICYHWNESYKTIIEHNSLIDNMILVRLEDIISDEDRLIEVFEFMGLPYKKVHFEIFSKPTNVSFPINFRMSNEQEEMFWGMCSNIMNKLGYDRKGPNDVRY